jgi:16S rRNA processing protein RimM
MQELCVMARICSPHGVKGCVKAVSFAEDITGLAGQKVYVVRADGVRDERILKKVFGVVGDKCILEIDGVGDVENAREIQDCDIVVPVSQLPELSHDEYYHFDLVGCNVYDTAGVCRGKVRRVHEQMGGDIAEVAEGAGYHYILLTKDWVTEVDVQEKRLVIDKAFWE